MLLIHLNLGRRGLRPACFFLYEENALALCGQCSAVERSQRNEAVKKTSHAPSCDWIRKASHASSREETSFETCNTPLRLRTVVLPVVQFAPAKLEFHATISNRRRDTPAGYRHSNSVPLHLPANDGSSGTHVDRKNSGVV